jgi:N utilization substance protein B
MNPRRAIRRLALQALYQFDLRREPDPDAIRETLLDLADDPGQADEAMALAQEAWSGREAADQLASELSPDWPTARQPPLDRSILRLTYHEMVSGHAPPKVAINEAIELAKQFCSEHSPPFLNGVLDKMLRHLRDRGRLPAGTPATDQPVPPADAPDPWLDDALRPSQS